MGHLVEKHTYTNAQTLTQFLKQRDKIEMIMRLNLLGFYRARREQLKNKGEVKQEEASPSFADAIAKEYER